MKNKLFISGLACALVLAGGAAQSAPVKGAKMKPLFTYKTKKQIKAENTHNNNPWGLVYQDALASNLPGKVNLHAISYDLNGLKIAANVYTPANYNPANSWL